MFVVVSSVVLRMQAKGAVMKYSAMHRTAPTTKSYLAQNVNNDKVGPLELLIEDYNVYMLRITFDKYKTSQKGKLLH